MFELPEVEQERVSTYESITPPQKKQEKWNNKDVHLHTVSQSSAELPSITL